MLDNPTLQQAELYFRTMLHTIVPLHRALIDEMRKTPSPPLELATRLEDIGHEYIQMANDLARTLIESGQIDREPDPDDYAETRIEAFARRLIAKSGVVRFADGSRLDGASALAAAPVVEEAIKTAMWIAKSQSEQSVSSNY